MDFKRVLASTLVASMVSVPCSAASDILSTAKTAMSAVATVVGGESAVAHTVAFFKENKSKTAADDFGRKYALVSCPEGMINFDKIPEVKADPNGKTEAEKKGTPEKEGCPVLSRSLSLTVSGLMTLGGVLGFIA